MIDDVCRYHGMDYMNILHVIPNTNHNLRAYYHSESIESPIEFSEPIVGFQLVEFGGGLKQWVCIGATSCNACHCGPDVESTLTLAYKYNQKTNRRENDNILAGARNYVGVFESQEDGLNACKNHVNDMLAGRPVAVDQ